MTLPCRSEPCSKAALMWSSPSSLQCYADDHVILSLSHTHLAITQPVCFQHYASMSVPLLLQEVVTHVLAADGEASTWAAAGST